MEKPWVEKYRPKTLDEITGHDEIIKRLKSYVKKKSMPHMLFSGPPGVGKCLTGDTKVIVNNKIENLGDIVEKISNGRFGATLVSNPKDLNVLGIDEDGNIKRFNVQYVYKDKTNKIIKIKTKYGRELKITTYHPLLVNKKDGTIKWEKAENLKIGDKLATSRYISLDDNNSDNLINEHKYKYENMMLEWLGYFIGNSYAGMSSNDGITNDNIIIFINNNYTLRKRFAELTQKLFDDAEIKERIHKDNTPSVYVNSKKAINIITDFRGKKSQIKIPNYVMNSLSLKYFIKAYFDCNAIIKDDSIVLYTASKNMAEDLCYALAKYEIISKLKTEHDKKHDKDYYCVIISDSSNIGKFLEEIGFYDKDKYNRAKTLLKNENPNLDVIAVDKSKIRYIADRLRIQLDNDYKKILGYAETKKTSFEISKKVYYKLEELKTIKKLIDKSILIDWDEVEKRKKHISEKTGIQSDIILEYINGKRKPSLKDYLKIAKCLNINIEDTIEAMRYFAKHYVGYAELSMGTWNSSIQSYLEEKTYDNIDITKLEEIRAVELKILNETLNDEKLMDAIAYVLFLTTNNLYWDEITDVKTSEGDFTIYDLHVPKYHNFIGGNLPTVLHNTTAALCLARDLYGENWRDNFLELNSSDERGIDVIRTKVKDFARTKPIGDAPFKIIFLDESDALTSDAQNALRRTMEKYSDICRFILSCNYPSRIIPPIQSRCAIFRFSPLKREDIIKKIKEIAENEGITIDESGIDAIIYVSEGDLRKAINVLQTAATVSKNINDEIIYKVSSKARPDEIIKMLELALNNKFIEARELLYNLMIDWGMSGEDILLQMFREIPNLDIEERKKVSLVEAIGECDFRIVEGANERIQLSALLAKIGMMKGD
ncbi:replication factor C small subunit [Methanothermococcus okinawensis]|uniref:Replication factor C small subunit n=1 Tax=Methanothermococcus okinawensis (strain DSM 14208 / JCM 11175 / IH1) TaxID=647113 RepID=F8ALG6_METOI|nr:replication factor C small subunit [Methanothermococcus okinawensis]AEH06559.1 Replication factor C [Methanothermococcus okinawensis IH1]